MSTSAESIHWRKLFLALSTSTSIATIGVTCVGITNTDIYKSLVPDDILPGCLSQDLVSLGAALLLPNVASRSMIDGSLRDTTLWLGLTGYLMYAYGIYVFEAVVNKFYFCYISIFGTCLWEIIIIMSSVSYQGIHIVQKNIELPKKTLMTLFVALGILFPVLWIMQLIPAMASGTPPPGVSIMAMDLSFAIPSLWLCVWSMYSDMPISIIVAPALSVKAGVLGSSVLLGCLLQPWFDRPIPWNEVPVYTLLGPVTLIIAWKTWLCLPRDSYVLGGLAAKIDENRKKV